MSILLVTTVLVKKDRGETFRLRRWDEKRYKNYNTFQYDPEEAAALRQERQRIFNEIVKEGDELNLETFQKLLRHNEEDISFVKKDHFLMW